jgi:hypothetical protein
MMFIAVRSLFPVHATITLRVRDLFRTCHATPASPSSRPVAQASQKSDIADHLPVIHLTPAGFPSGMPGMGLEIDGAIQHAPQASRHCMDRLLFGDKADWADIVLWNALTAFSEFARVGLRP